MAESESGQEKTEHATAKRLQEAREEGDVVRSKELNTMLVTLVSALTFLAFGDTFTNRFIAYIKSHLVISKDLIFDTDQMLTYLINSMISAILIISPMFIVAFITALFSPMLLGGWSFSMKSLGFKFERMDPIAGIARVASLQNLVEIAKALFKFFLIAVCAITLIYLSVDELIQLGREPLHRAVEHSASLFGWAFLLLAFVLFIIAAFDVPFQIWQHSKKLSMTRQELREEAKQTDGRPEIRSRIRSIQREMANRKMMEKLPQADVVIINPTHYSVALKYDQHKASAPIVLAKGTDIVALKIREIAAHHQIPIFSAPPLARAIYYTTKLERQIPPNLYLAVAKVLAYVFQLKMAKRSGFMEPAAPLDLDVPEKFKQEPYQD